MTKETWIHICPIHGEETCLAERIPKEQGAYVPVWTG